MKSIDYRRLLAPVYSGRRAMSPTELLDALEKHYVSATFIAKSLKEGVLVRCKNGSGYLELARNKW